MPSALERLCQQQEVPFIQLGDGIVVETSSTYAECTHPIFLTEVNNGIAALVKFPEPAKRRIEKVDEFCYTVTNMLEGGNRLLHDPQPNCFSFIGPIDKEELQESLEIIALYCDVLLPLVQRVGETGRWDHPLIGLAFVPAHKLNSA